MIKLRNILKEDLTPKGELQKKFPEVLVYGSDKVFSDLEWKVISTEKWDSERAAEFQYWAGKPPAGYGGPYDFRETELPDGNFKYTWTCASSS